MAWVKLDDGFMRNPKVQTLEPRALKLYLAALCYAAAHLTDGHVPPGSRRAVCGDAGVDLRGFRTLAATLQDAGLWELNADGWVIHDYLLYNPSRAQVLAKREADRRRKQRERERGE